MLVTAVMFSVDRALSLHGASVPRPANHELATLADFWNAASRITGDDLALRVAADLPVGALGLASYAMVSARTLGDALALLGDTYLGRLVPGLKLRVVPCPEAQVELRLVCEDGESSLMPLLEEVVLAVVHRHFSLLAMPAQTLAVRLRRPPPVASAELWRAFFGARPRFAQRYSALRIAASSLTSELRTANSELQQIVLSSDLATTESTSCRVRRHVRAHLRSAVDAGTIARALDMTSRTLQRRLQAEQTSLRAVVAGVRIEVACEMLGDGEASIADVARDVGFSGPASFSRAFLSAKGESPQAYRKRLR